MPEKVMLKNIFALLVLLITPEITFSSPSYASNDINQKQQLPTCRIMPVLRRNDNQKTALDSVKLLQKALKKYYGNASLKVDGFFGKKTEDSVIEYQSRVGDHDLTFSVDGIVGLKTWESLGVCS